MPLIMLPVRLLALSLPTFLAYNSIIVTDAWYSYEFSSGEFVESTYSTGEGLNIFKCEDAGPILYYVPDDHYIGIGESIDMLQGVDESDVWRKTDRWMTKVGAKVAKWQHDLR